MLLSELERGRREDQTLSKEVLAFAVHGETSAINGYYCVIHSTRERSLAVQKLRKCYVCSIKARMSNVWSFSGYVLQITSSVLLNLETDDYMYIHRIPVVGYFCKQRLTLEKKRREDIFYNVLDMCDE